MKIKTILSPTELPALAQRDLSNTACVVFDILRATSTFVTALHHGAKEIIPVSEISEAIALKKKLPDVLLAGERDGLKISEAQSGGIDFDLGNSPREFSPERVRGKTIVSTTTNGTRALRACIGAKMILAASFLNLSETAKFLRSQSSENILLICAGTGENEAAEDVLAAGALAELLLCELHPNNPMVGRAVPCPPPGVVNLSPLPKPSDGAHGVTRPTLSDSAQTAQQAWLEAKSELPAAIANSQNGQRLLGIPALRDDVAFCSQQDIFNLIAAMDGEGHLRCVA